MMEISDGPLCCVNMTQKEACWRRLSLLSSHNVVQVTYCTNANLQQSVGKYAKKYCVSSI